MVLYMLNTRDTQISRYAPFLLKNIVDYESASTRDKERINLLVTSNSTGKPGCCIPLDMLCEHKVKTVKQLLRSFQNQLETTLITKAVLAENSTVAMKEHFFESIGKGKTVGGGEHRHDLFKNGEKEVVRSQLQRLNMFSSESSRRTEVNFHVKSRKVWETLDDEKVDLFLDRNCRNYKLKNTYRFDK